MKPRRFFIHYNKPETQRRGKVQVSVHFKNTCYIVDNVMCNVPTEGKIGKRQPLFVMCGFAQDVSIKNNIATIV